MGNTGTWEKAEVPKSERVQVWVSAEERFYVDAALRITGQSLADFVREAVAIHAAAVMLFPRSHAPIAAAPAPPSGLPTAGRDTIFRESH